MRFFVCSITVWTFWIRFSCRLISVQGVLTISETLKLQAVNFHCDRVRLESTRRVQEKFVTSVWDFIRLLLCVAAACGADHGRYFVSRFTWCCLCVFWRNVAVFECHENSRWSWEFWKEQWENYARCRFLKWERVIAFSHILWKWAIVTIMWNFLFFKGHSEIVFSVLFPFPYLNAYLFALCWLKGRSLLPVLRCLCLCCSRFTRVGEKISERFWCVLGTGTTFLLLKVARKM